MLAKITQTMAQNLAPQKRLFRVSDTLLKGFVMIVRPSGKKTFVVDYRRADGKRTDHKIGAANVLPVAEAREIAREFLAAIARGEEPTVPSEVLTLKKLLDDFYGPWVTENRKTGRETVFMIQRSFESFLDIEISQFTLAQFEQWRTQRKKKQGVKASSINREVTALKAALNWGVTMDIIETNPLSKFKPLSESDSEKIVRYLSEDERSRLMKALDMREERMRKERQSHNNWLKERGESILPKHGYYVDHVKPMILVSLYTGIRRNALFSLEWRDVNFNDRVLFLRAKTAKTETSNFVPMNDLVYDVFSRWREQNKSRKPTDLVFPSPKTGKKMNNCNTAWESLLKEAEIEDFRWHDMRHDFASQLVIRGVDLNTVRELLGHADLKMTLRYAHLAPAVKMKAVAMMLEPLGKSA